MMDDDKQFSFDYSTQSGSCTSDNSYSITYSGGSTTATYDSDVTSPSFTIDIGDMNDTGSEFTYNDPTYTQQHNEVGGKMRERLEAIEARLNILVPDPKKLEKFEALKKAYEHYKHLEKLCEIEEE